MTSSPLRTLVTAFTAFDRFAVNPSALVAERIGLPFIRLEVSYEAVDQFVDGLDGNAFDQGILMGVAGSSSNLRLEMIAQNRIDRIPDVRGFIPPNMLIDDNSPAQLVGTLWPGELLEHPPASVVRSVDAGGYLCNYLYFRMLQRFANKRIGFLHVPPLEMRALEAQVEIATRILEIVGTESGSSGDASQVMR